MSGEGPLVSCLSVVLVAGVVFGPAGCLPELVYLFFWLSWPVSVLQTVMICTSSDWHTLLLVRRVGFEGIASGWDSGGVGWGTVGCVFGRI